MITRRKILVAAAAAVAVAASAPFAAYSLLKRRPAGKEVVAWLKANAIPLASAEPGSGFKDLEAIGEIVGRARIVAVGEATHGTHEFVTLRHRLVEYCVSRFGFAMIGLETPFGGERPINDYVVHGKGSAADAVRRMTLFIWRYEEMVAIVEWVRAWNLAHDRKVKFYGFDMQSTGAATLRLLDYLKPVAPELASEVEATLKPSVFKNLATLPAAAQEQVLAQVKRLLDRFDSERAPWISRTSEPEWRLARLSATVLDQCAHRAQINDPDERAVFRDHSMADNACALLEAEGPDVKALLLAHNYHVKRGPSYPDPTLGKGLPDMGCFLHAKFGTELATIGFSFNQGGFFALDVAHKPREVTVDPAPDDLLDAALAATGLPLFALRLDGVPAQGPVAEWMASKPYQRSIGAHFVPETYHGLLKLGLPTYMMAGDPREFYDVLFFVETTTAPARLGGGTAGVT